LLSIAKILSKTKNFCDKQEQRSLLQLPSKAKILSKAKNFCDKREQKNFQGF
jgi:hypothetical protein